MEILAEIDWNLIRSFLAVAEEGSLSSAGRRLMMTQPTLGRHIQQLETTLQTTLFTRHARGLQLSEAGIALIEPAREMARAAGKLALEAAGQADNETGTVRISTSVMVASYHMPAILADLRQLAPKIEIELHATDSSDNLLFREADIAVRMYRPEQLDLSARKLGKIDIGLFATRKYLTLNGTPKVLQDLLEHDVIGFDRSELVVRVMREKGLMIDRHFSKIRCDDQAAYWHLVRAGCGIGAGQMVIGNADPDLVQVLPDLDLPPFPVWLTMPMALRNTPRVRKVYTLLAARLSAIIC